VLAGDTYGQKTNTQVYLKDSTILKGRIIVDNNFYVRLVKPSEDTIQVGYKLIRSVGKQPNNYQNRSEKIIKTNGIAISVMGNLIYSEETKISYNTQVILTKIIKNGTANFGVAIGYDKFNFTTNFLRLESKFLSSAVYARYYLSKKTTRSLIDGKLGYAWALDSIDEGGFTHEYNGEIASAFGVGFHLPSRRTTSLIIRSGVNYIRTSGEIAFNFGNENKTVYNRRFIHPYIGIALEF
jgi:hypothetical protein